MVESSKVTSIPAEKTSDSNRMIVLLAALLAVGILIDGKLYNRPDRPHHIYSLDTPSQIVLTQDQQTIMAFSRHSQRWVLTTPTTAPAAHSRLQFLLDSNVQTERSYKVSQIPFDELFSDPVTLSIDGHVFTFGQIEPVSQLRYVRAGDNVYLQADHVIPLLQAGPGTFIDLQVSQDVIAVSIGATELANIDKWQNLQGLGIISMDSSDAKAITSVRLVDNQKQLSVFNVFSIDNSVVLQPENTAYGFLISAKQAWELGLASN